MSTGGEHSLKQPPFGTASLANPALRVGSGDLGTEDGFLADRSREDSPASPLQIDIEACQIYLFQLRAGFAPSAWNSSQFLTSPFAPWLREISGTSGVVDLHFDSISISEIQLLQLASDSSISSCSYSNQLTFVVDS